VKSLGLCLLVLLAVANLSQVPVDMRDRSLQAENEWQTYYLFERITLANTGGTEIQLNMTDRLYSLFMNFTIQRSYLLNTSHRVARTFKDNDSMPVMELDLPGKVPPNRYFQYHVTQKLVVHRTMFMGPELDTSNSGTLSQIPEDIKANFTGSTGPWQYDSPQMAYLAEVARNLSRGDQNALSVLFKIITWVGNNTSTPTESDGFQGPRYPNETLPKSILGESTGAGDCDDQSNTLILMCRAVGLPSFLQIGGIYHNGINSSVTWWKGHLQYYERNVGWHGWAMVYVPRWGWLPVDLVWYYLVTGKTEPRQAIVGSAAAVQSMIYIGNLSVTDYIADTREIKKTLEGSNLYIRVDHVLVPEGLSLGDVSLPPLTFPWKGNYTTATATLSTQTTKTLSTTSTSSVTTYSSTYQAAALVLLAVAVATVVAFLAGKVARRLDVRARAGNDI